MNEKTAIILFNLGGPNNLESVQPFLENLFRDPDIFKIPLFQGLIAKVISMARAPKVKKEYDIIGGSSPINYWTERQRKLLEKSLQEGFDNIEVFTAMRYWHPLIKDVANEISKKYYKRVILLPLYPQYSFSTTNSAYREWKRVFTSSQIEEVFIKNFNTNKFYINAVNQRIDETLQKFPKEIQKDVQLLFSAHGLPESFVKKGDPYPSQIRETIKLVMEAREHSHEFHLCYQSKVGPVKWLKPSTENTIQTVIESGKKNLLIVPISFVCDHVETLYELDIEYRHIAEQLSVEKYVVMEGLNDSELFILALKEEICERL
ncbi:MAG: ferrochelatase [Ignavibacteria bacterium]|nr:ferrochelatase [Ignavibacteria bacterium]